MIAVLTLISALLIQVATNYFNDALDFAKGADTPARLGPLRVTASGLIPPRTVMRAGFACLAVASIAAVPLVLRGGLPIVILGVASLACAWLYTGGPRPLAYLGLGEVFVIAFFGVLAVSGTLYLQQQRLSGASLLAGLQIGLHASVLLALNNYRDIAGDRKAAKRTLAARFGENFARRELTLLILSPYALGAIWWDTGQPTAAMLPLISLPIAIHLLHELHRTPPSSQCNPLLARAASLHLVFGALLSGALLTYGATS